ncbi:hypothetical protein RchiOBHm_Chr5g0074691 [Rosa chinensis]|uniref:Uncharacterized protein n=1 Tax=Rosa chinensis TaxID=74649 RepID=A0A2P6QL93_ROSCH|nr:hypothetical protein RchiOBHm_Chr5g0074691 [Rosa chinensis]
MSNCYLIIDSYIPCTSSMGGCVFISALDMSFFLNCESQNALLYFNQCCFSVGYILRVETWSLIASYSQL